MWNDCGSKSVSLIHSENAGANYLHVFFCRMFELVGDDNAISDTVYFLAKALNSERIDLATFMKVI